MSFHFHSKNIALIAFAGLCLSSASFADNTTEGQLPRFDQIIGGEAVSSEDPIASTTVALLNNGSICTGSIIAKDLIVTAGHCVGPDKKKMKVLFRTSLKGSGTAAAVLGFVRHSGYDEGDVETDMNDIALVRFEGELPQGFKPAMLVQDPADLYDGEEVTLAGYGITTGSPKRGSDAGAGTLRKVAVNIQQTRFGRTEVLLDQSHGQGACHGDSGGPAFIFKDGQYYLFGVTSRGPLHKPDNCASESIYTNILAHKSFMKQATIQLRQN